MAQARGDASSWAASKTTVFEREAAHGVGPRSDADGHPESARQRGLAPRHGRQRSDASPTCTPNSVKERGLQRRELVVAVHDQQIDGAGKVGRAFEFGQRKASLRPPDPPNS